MSMAGADRLGTSRQDSALIFATAPLQIYVQLVQVTRFGKRHPVVAPEVSAFPFNTALLVAAGRVAELALKPPVRSEGDETACLLAAMSAQDLLYGTLQVVIAKHAEDSAEVSKCQLMSLEKCLLCGTSIGAVVGRTAAHRSHLEDLQPYAFAAQNGPGFVPIHLGFRPPRVRLWHEYFAAFQSQLLPPPSYEATNRTFTPAEARQFDLQTIKNATRRMALLRRC